MVFGRSILAVPDVFTKWCPVMVNDCLTQIHEEACSIALRDFHPMDGQLQCRIHVDDPLGQFSIPWNFRWLFLSPRRSNVQVVGWRAGKADPFNDLGVGEIGALPNQEVRGG